MAPSISTTQHNYTLSGLLSSPPHRLDNRSLLAFRPLHVSKGVAPQAAGSAQCILGGTKCTVVVSAEVVDGDEAARGPYLSCDVDCPSSIPQGTNLTSLLLVLQKTLSSALSSADLARDQFIVLRSSSAPHQPTKAWSLHFDVTFTDIQGGNLADVMFAAVWSALGDVRLPRTRAIGFDTDLLNSNRQSEGNLDSFDIKGNIKGSLARNRNSTGATAANAKAQAAAGSKKGEESMPVDQSIKEKTGMDFEVMDIWDNGVFIEGSQTAPIAVTVNLLPTEILLDATLAEEVCFPPSKRLLVLCNPSTGKVVGVHMIPPTLDASMTSAGEDTSKVREALLGTAELKAIRKAIQDGQGFAQSLHGAIQSQMAATGKDTEMQAV